MKLKCTFIEPMFAAALETIFRRGRVYEATPIPASAPGAVDVHSGLPNQSLKAIPEGEGYSVVSLGDVRVAKFAVHSKRKKQFYPRETNVRDRLYDARRMRRFARQVLKRPITNPARINDEIHRMCKKIARNHGK